MECCNKVGGINTPSHPTLYGSDIWRIIVQFRSCNLFPTIHLLSEAYFFYSLSVIVPKIPTLLFLPFFLVTLLFQPRHDVLLSSPWRLKMLCHTRFMKANRMHLICAPGSVYTHMIKHKVNITTSANVKRVLKTLLQNRMSKANK